MRPVSLLISFHDVFAFSSSSAVSMPCFLYYGTHGRQSSAREVVVVTLAVRPSAGRRPSMPLLSVGQGDFCQSRWGPFTNDVRKFCMDFQATVPSLSQAHSRNLSVLTSHFGQPLLVDVICDGPLGPSLALADSSVTPFRCFSLGRRSLPFHGREALGHIR